MNTTITIGTRTVELSDETSRLVAADIIQEQDNDAKAEFRAKMMRDLADCEWPSGVDMTQRFTQEIMYRLSSAIDSAATRWLRGEFRGAVAELSPGVVGISFPRLRCIVRTQDVGRVIADHLRDEIHSKVSRVIQFHGHERAAAGGWQYPDEPDVAAAINGIAAITRGATNANPAT